MHFLFRTIVGAIILVYLFEEEEKSQHIFETHNFFINSHKIMSSFFYETRDINTREDAKT